MTNRLDRRGFMRLAGLGTVGAVFASALPGFVQAQAAARGGAGAFMHEHDFFFLQLSDTHWGFEGPPNPDAKGTLKKAIRSINALEQRPDFIVFTGDLTHTTDDPAERRRRMTELKQIVGALEVESLRFMPGEHDAALDNGDAYRELFGATHYSFDHKGIHFIALDNVSDPRASIGDAQLAWLAEDLRGQKRDAPIVVFAHRPLFDLAPEWDWATRDGAKAVELLTPYAHVTVFYGHIHQEHHHMTGHIAHHAARSLMFPLPAPKSQPKRAPLPWNPAEPYKGLGFRGVDADAHDAKYGITEYPVEYAAMRSDAKGA
ncbi:MAG TPA: metallophosphoesterase [Gammaproteobacteria bacterium]|nr:metallophosphoesterase [Gammaproteobacteria bacterium]